VFGESARNGPAGRIILQVTTALVIGLVLAAWVVLPLPLAVLVGRCLREEPAASFELAS